MAKEDYPETKGVGSPTPLLTRNETIRALRAEELVPLLPFEAEILRGRMQGHLEAQRKLGALLGQAMNQSSETWHDNAPADAINNESRALAERARSTNLGLEYGHLLPYPEASEATVTLGSLVGVRYQGDADVEHVLITGYCRELADDIRHVLPEDTEPVTLTSPLGQALLDANEGQTVGYEVSGGRQLKVTVDSLRQLGALVTPDPVNEPSL